MRAEPVTGHLLAVLRNAIYLESDDGRIICIVDGEIDGPLTLRVADLTPLRSVLASRPGGTFKATREALYIPGAVPLLWADTPRWLPQLPQEVGPASERLRAAQTLARLIEDVGRLEGCAPFIAQLIGAWRAMPLQQKVPSDALSSRIVRCLHEARDAIQRADYEESAHALVALIGLGPGLTPSGDDLVAGVIASLVWQARLGCVPGELASGIVEAIRAVAPTRTNRISTRLLWYACEGILYRPAMELGVALLSGNVDAIASPAAILFSIGNTTGIDLAAGLVIGALMGIESDTIAYTGKGRFIITDK